MPAHCYALTGGRLWRKLLIKHWNDVLPFVSWRLHFVCLNLIVMSKLCPVIFQRSSTILADSDSMLFLYGVQ